MQDINEHSKIAIIGAGPAGMTAAWKLYQKGYRNVVIFEHESEVGGRTHSETFPNSNHHHPHQEKHIIDTGAGWLTNFYHETFALMQEMNLKQDLVLRKRQIRGASDLYMKNAEINALPLTRDQITESKFLTTEDKQKLLQYLDRVLEKYSNSLTMNDEEETKTTANEEYTKELGENIKNNVMKPLFEGPFFCQLEELSAGMTNSWLGALLHPQTEFYQMAEGMDSLCRHIAMHLRLHSSFEILCNRTVISVSHPPKHHSSSPSPSSFDRQNETRKFIVKYLNHHHHNNNNQSASDNNNNNVRRDEERGIDIDVKIFDFIIFALPAPTVAAIITTPPPNESIIPPSSPSSSSQQRSETAKEEFGISLEVIQSIYYAPHVRAYLSRISDEQKQVGYHLVPVHPPLATVEWFSSDMGAWGSCPAGRQWMLLCATADASVNFLLDGDDDDTIIKKLWTKAKEIVPDLFAIDHADVKHVVRWEAAIPVLSPSACVALRHYTPILPVVFCGDWTYQPCIEGAVRSAIRATDVFPSFSSSPYSNSSKLPSRL